ncbi:IS4 family transposase [Planomonospora sp. ID91781]|uniref:IS4 family transposase n=1 Tax=Planomonospora sp. ID91781 TaxID=2738135 RepID=UPI0018C44242|nr:IS4 family transposase [Planomonospora sp. ID91781]MBG0825987.1 IS4 family transposase [Planomonospora sp. ID91781]
MPVHTRIGEKAVVLPSPIKLRGHLLDRLNLGAVTELVPSQVVDEVIIECGRGEKRLRVLPARITLYFVLALWLCPGAGYGEVLRMLFDQFYQEIGTGLIRVPTGAAAVQARRRLGREPLKALFRRLCGAHADRDAPGMSAFGCQTALLKVAVDGTTLDVPDTVANRTAFGPAPGRSSKDPGRCPQIRVLMLIACGTRSIMDAVWAGRSTGEGTLLRKLVRSGGIRPGMLVLADRYFSGSPQVTAITSAGAHLIIRANLRRRLPVLKALPDGSFLSLLPAANQLTPELIARARAKGVRGHVQRRGVRARQAAGLPIRVIHADIGIVPEHGEPRVEPYLLITTLLDPTVAPAAQVAALYAERWEAETGYADLKIHLSGPQAVFRSKDPDGVAQEVYALFIVYQIVQIARATAAREHPRPEPVDPDRISFTVTLRALVRSIGRAAACGLSAVLNEIWASPQLVRRSRTKTRERKGTLAYARAVQKTPLSRTVYTITIRPPDTTEP